MRNRHISSSDSVPSQRDADDDTGAMIAQKQSGHISVLLHESLDALDIQPFDTVIDATLGGAGHAAAIARKLGKEGHLIGFDLDSQALERAQAALKTSTARTTLIEANFRTIREALPARGISIISKALFDLGWSSYQLNDGRGFSFLKDEPLLMTYSAHGPHALTARDIVNDWAEDSIASVIYGWGEERFSRHIARGIVEARARRSIETALELADIIRASVPAAYARGRLHPATKSFQALRIAVNDELGALEEGLAGAWELLESKGRIAVISFHSIEDRIVKRIFTEWVKSGNAKLVLKKPLPPSREELRRNPRARSAKLRCIEKK